MLQNATTVRGGTTARLDQPTPQRTGDDGGRGVTQLTGGTARTGQATGIVMNPLHGGVATAATHYLDRNNQVQPRSIMPLSYDAASLRHDTGGATTWGSIKNAVPFLGKTTYGAILKGAERFENAAPGLSGAAKETQLTALKKDIDAWQAKHGDGSGPTASPKEKAIARMAASVGQALDEARFDGAREKLLAKLPQGMTIAHDGSIGGSAQITGIPIGAKGLKDFEGLTTAQFVDKLATSGIAPKTDKDGSLKPLGTIAGIPVAGQASNDLYRLDLTIDTGRSTYVSRQDPETGEAERNKTAVQQLRAFAGSDKATTVLSGIVNQQVLRPLSDGMTRPDGAQAQVALGHHGAHGQVKQRDGSFDDVRMYNMGSASFSLSKTPMGDFRVSVDWPMFIVDTERGGHEHSLPGLQQGDVIKAQGHMELVIDAREAAQGRVRVTTPTPPTVQFSGGMNL